MHMCLEPLLLSSGARVVTWQFNIKKWIYRPKWRYKLLFGSFLLSWALLFKLSSMVVWLVSSSIMLKIRSNLFLAFSVNLKLGSESRMTRNGWTQSCAFLSSIRVVPVKILCSRTSTDSNITHTDSISFSYLQSSPCATRAHWRKSIVLQLQLRLAPSLVLF
jgi:hypothetical protein